MSSLKSLAFKVVYRSIPAQKIFLRNVEAEPVEVLAESLAVTLLATKAVASELKKPETKNEI